MQIRAQISSLPLWVDNLGVQQDWDHLFLCRRQRLKSAKGQGIAIAAGGPLNLANTYVTLHMLRKVHGSSLPVEIFFNGEDEFDLKTQQLFEASQYPYVS